ncbi:MAG: tRNA (N(6)-L-threonylcarbamoyladenosine(37)-C(2))-methylthiotransferase MtaB [Bacteroidales bacterium]|nr:tRNA (N(6)-L-threonylcarbamoyladenosine(37)-C(2))-methylthiotransferase MtaB [Bacteroidales bacterium]
MNNSQGALRVSYHTLGCKLNFAETSTIGRLLSEKGWLRAQPGEEPALCVVNTCSVTEMADKKGRQLIRQLHRRHPQARIVVTGCYAQLKPGEVSSLPGVSIVLGQDKKGEIADYVAQLTQEVSTPKVVEVKDFKELREFVPACERGDRTRYWLKVQDGCDYWCSYCTIPMARGRSRSASVEACVEQARKVAAEDGREIVLTGINVGCFGQERGESLLQLIRALDEVEGISRYRISSIEPNLLTPEIIDFVAGSRAFMPHFHVPLQSGSDEVLRLMRRRYDTALFASRMELIRSRIPHAFIGVDIIAGARGETPEEWQRSLEFASSLPVQQLHVFPYSERPGTRALEIGGIVPQEEKHRRVAQLLKVSEQKYAAFMKANAGTRRPVLWEQPHAAEGVMHGFTDNYLRVEAPLAQGMINRITPVALGEPIDSECLSGQIITEL